LEAVRNEEARTSDDQTQTCREPATNTENNWDGQKTRDQAEGRHDYNIDGGITRNDILGIHAHKVVDDHKDTPNIGKNKSTSKKTRSPK